MNTQNGWKDFEKESIDFDDYHLIEAVKTVYDAEKNRDICEHIILTKEDFNEHDFWNIIYWRVIA